ncbi:MAG: hypothetical protein R3B49_10350 [Phycisphaerales bacterium]
MSGILSWIKGHLLIVVSGVLILLFLPAGFVGSRMWNTKIRAKAEDEYKKQDRELSGQQRVQYTLPAVLEGESAVEEARAPNARVTDYYASRKQTREEQVGEIVERATAFNRESHDVLVPGLFPEASSAREQVTLLGEFRRRLVGDERQAGVYELFLRRQGAGSPPDPEEISGVLNEAQQRLQDQLNAGASTSSGRATTATPEQQKAMQDELAAQRIALYAARADDLTYYVLPDAITGAAAPGFASVPTATYTANPTIEQAFGWQWDEWVLTDVLRAVAAANSDAVGAPLGVPAAPIKRVDKIAVRFKSLAPKVADDSGRSSSAGEASPTPTYTGRLEAAGTDFDVRMVRLEAIVAPSKLPRFFDALAKTNYMTVTGLQLDPVDPWTEIDAGYYFGSDSVARATIDIETVWLRSWTGPLMPPSVREALGVVLPEAAEAEPENVEP